MLINVAIEFGSYTTRFAPLFTSVEAVRKMMMDSQFARLLEVNGVPPNMGNDESECGYPTVGL